MINLFGSKAIMASSSLGVASTVTLKAAEAGLISLAFNYLVVPMLKPYFNKYKKMATEGAEGLVGEVLQKLDVNSEEV